MDHNCQPARRELLLLARSALISRWKYNPSRMDLRLCINPIPPRIKNRFPLLQSEFFRCLLGVCEFDLGQATA